MLGFYLMLKEHPDLAPIPRSADPGAPALLTDPSRLLALQSKGQQPKRE